MSLTITKQNSVDSLAKSMGSLPRAVCPVTHRFTPSLYAREIFMPKGSFIVSRTHKTTHPYVISKGRVSVWSQDKGVEHLQAPFTGITTPGTQRVLYIHEDCVWTTFHVTDEKDPEKIGELILEPMSNVIDVGPDTMKQLMEVE